jgi:ribosomal protein L31
VLLRQSYVSAGHPVWLLGGQQQLNQTGSIHLTCLASIACSELLQLSIVLAGHPVWLLGGQQQLN